MPECFTFFARADSPFSQHYTRAPFSRHGVRFATAEHYMMWRKARLFGAPATLLEAILAADARGAKALGRQVPGFLQPVWDEVARSIVSEGSFAKFSQNAPALAALLATAGTTLVEAAPWDRIWGIGLAADDPRALSRATWLGQNWLGEVLTDIRDTFLAVRAVS